MNLLQTQMDSTRFTEGPRRKTRRIKGLKWVELRPDGPFGKKRKQDRQRGCVKKGNAYETKAGRALHRMIQLGQLEPGELVLGQWFLFADANGTGWAQTDAFMVTEKQILLMEMKLTQTDSATPQLLSLYLPLMRHIYQGVPIVCLQVCKILRYVPTKMVDGPQELLDRPGPGVYTWHFRGDV